MLPGCTVVPCATSAEVFAALMRRRAPAAVIPIENSLAGSVAEHFDLLLAHAGLLFVRAEGQLRIRHHLIAAPGARSKDIRRVFSHPVALAQCRKFFQKHPRLEAVPFYDTAGSVKHVVENNLRDAAGIASRQAAEVYGASILKSGLEDNPRNLTRFFLVQPSPRVPAGANKVSLVFALKNVPGALFGALEVFALAGISLSKIESRPVPGRPWEYVFYADLMTPPGPVLRRSLKELGAKAQFVKFLGTYRSASSS